MVLRVPLSLFRQGPALTLKQVEVMGLSLSQTWHGALVNTSLLSLCGRCGWPAHVVRACGSDSKQGIAATVLRAPKAASWISAMTPVVANALKHAYADLFLFQQFQTLCTRMRGRLQQTQLAFVLPPKARVKGRLLKVSRQAQWGLRTSAYVEEQARETSVEAATLAEALRGLQPLQTLLTIFVRNTPWLHAVMRMVQTPGVSRETMHACQQPLGGVPARSPLRKAINHSLPPYVPMVASSASPLVGSREVIESLIGKAKQRLEAHGRSELHKAILLLPCLCGALPHDLVAKALTTVRVQDVTTWGAEEVGETRLSVRRRALGRRQPRKPETKTAELFAKAG